MITECTVWRGAYTSLYQDEMDEWMGRGDLDASVYHCSELPPGSDFSSIVEGGLFGEKYLILLGAEEPSWMDGKVRLHDQLLSALDEQDCDVHVGFVFSGGEAPDWVTSRDHDLRDRRIPSDTYEETAEWLRTWLRERRVVIDAETATTVAYRAGWDIDQVAGVAARLAGAGGKVYTQDEVIVQMGQLGYLEKNSIRDAILSGDLPATIAAWKRSSDQWTPYTLLGHLVYELRSVMLLVANPRTTLDDLADTNIRIRTEGHLGFLRSRARELNGVSAGRVLLLLDEADNLIKGGSRLDATTVMEHLVYRLCIECS